MPQITVDLCGYCQEVFKPSRPSSFVTSGILLPVQGVKTITQRLWCRICEIIHVKIRPHCYTEEHSISFMFMDFRIGLKLRLELEQHHDNWVFCDLAMLRPELANDIVFANSLSDTTESQISRRFLSNQLRHCLENHPSCHKITTPPEKSCDWTPRRLLWVSGPDLEKVYLITDRSHENLSQDQSKGEDIVRYLTLSHCWGNAPIPLLTQTTVNSLLEGIPIASLPKTFRDAIQIAKDLGYEYLWIDSLCIFQDNPDDWNYEANRMHDIYRNADCNIAATGAEDSTEGLFFEHTQETDCPFWIDVSWPLDTIMKTPQAEKYLIITADQATNSVEKAPLNQRAWVMQERILSSRVVSFTKDQIFWECLETRASESFPMGMPDVTRPHWRYDKSHIKQYIYKGAGDSSANSGDNKLILRQKPLLPILTEGVQAWQNSMYKEWRYFLASYTRCKLTKAADKLVALRGIAHQFSRQMQLDLDKYFVAGIWLSQFCLELCWFTFKNSNASRPAEWRAPSWSWANIDAQINPGSMRHHVNCEGLTETVKLVYIDKKVNKSGELLQAALRIEGKIIPAVLIYETSRDGGTQAKVLTIASKKPPTEEQDDLTVLLDLPRPNMMIGELEEVFLLPVLRCGHNSVAYIGPMVAYDSMSMGECLIMLRCRGTEDKYMRIGLLQTFSGLVNFVSRCEGEERVILTLI